MSQSVDISLIPIAFRPSQLEQELNALFIAYPPRYTARSRDADRLIFYLPNIAHLPITRDSLEKTLHHIQSTYYKTKGAVTSAMRLTLEELNLHFLRQNDLALQKQSTPETEAKSVGIPITFSVLRLAQNTPPALFIAQCGHSQIVHISSKTVQRIYDPQRSGQGLGVSRSLSIHFLQIPAQADDYLLWIPSLTIPWKAPILQAIHGLALEKAHHHFLDKNNYDHLSANNRAILLQIQQGKGEIHIIKPHKSQVISKESTVPAKPVEINTEPVKPRDGYITPTPKEEAPEVQSEIVISQEAESRSTQRSLPISDTTISSPNQESPQPAQIPPLDSESPTAKPQPSGEKEPSKVDTVPDTASPTPQIKREAVSADENKPSDTSTINIPKPQSPPQQQRANIFQRLSFLSLPQPIQRLWKNFLLLLYRKHKTQPKREEAPSFQLPSSVMVAIAVLVPIVVVAITSMVYLQRGISSLNEEYYLKAQSIAVKAISEKDPQRKRRTIQESLALLDKAESYTITEKSSALRDYLEALTDEIDGIIRLDFQPVLSGRLPPNVDIKKILLIGDDLYLYNATQGNVLRAERTAQGFAIDPNFYCGPGSNVGPLIDVSPLTWNGDIKAALVGMDKSGQLLYCGGEKPLYHTLIPPDKGWGEPKIIVAEYSRLYILDTKTNAIWVYSSKEENDFSEKPFFLFSTKAPNIQDVLSMTVYRGDIYLLHKDGHLTKCIYNFWYQSSTRCEDQAAYTNARSDSSFYKIKRPDGSYAQLSQIIYAPPPDPSIYLLDSETLSIYHLSLRLTIQQEYRAQKELSRNKRPASAFYVGSNRVVFLAIGNNVYFASLP